MIDITLTLMIAALEREEFDKWWKDNDGEACRLTNSSPQAAGFAAWKARGAALSKCRGVTRDGCNYLAACGSLCNKCGQVH